MECYFLVKQLKHITKKKNIGAGNCYNGEKSVIEYSNCRAISGNITLQPDYYFTLADRIKHYGYGFKVNTVVNQLNFYENMSEFIRYSKPKRWKVLAISV